MKWIQSTLTETLQFLEERYVAVTVTMAISMMFTGALRSASGPYVSGATLYLLLCEGGMATMTAGLFFGSALVEGKQNLSDYWKLHALSGIALCAALVGSTTASDVARKFAFHEHPFGTSILPYFLIFVVLGIGLGAWTRVVMERERGH